MKLRVPARSARTFRQRSQFGSGAESESRTGKNMKYVPRVRLATMCYFVIVAFAPGAREHARAVLRSASHMRETANPSVGLSLPEGWIAAYLADEMCGCDMYSDPRVSENSESLDERIARFRKKHQKAKYRKRGWSDTRIEDTVRKMRNDVPATNGSRLRGIRIDVRSAIAELVQRVGAIRVLVHFFSGDIEEEPITADTNVVALDQFSTDDSLVLPDTWYELRPTDSIGDIVTTIDVGSVETLGDLHDLLAESFGFPEWYGRNWDAAWDCLRDPALSTLHSPVRISGWQRLESVLPRDATILRKLLEDLPLARSGVTVELIGESTAG